MEMSEAITLIRTLVQKVEQDQIDKGNEAYRYAYITGLLQSLLEICLSDGSERTRMLITNMITTINTTNK
jgi:hypothetical protein